MHRSHGNTSLAAFLYVTGLVEEDDSLAVITERTEKLSACLDRLIADLENLDDDASDEVVQSVFYESGKLYFSSELRWWFRSLYQILLRSNDGPRLGQFTKIMTIDWVTNRINHVRTDPWLA